MSVLLALESVSRRFGLFYAVDGVTLAVNEGTIHAVIGPNGAGKTTLFRVITGVLHPSSGRVLFRGKDMSRAKPFEIARAGLGQTFQLTATFPRLSVLESIQVALLASRRGTTDFWSFRHRAIRNEAGELLELVGLSDRAGFESRMLSHGDQRVLEVAVALATRPQLLLLDEPTSGMSAVETDRIVRLITDLVLSHKLTIILSEHDMDVVFGMATVVTVLHNGRVLREGTPREIRQDDSVNAVYLGEEH